MRRSVNPHVRDKGFVHDEGTNPHELVSFFWTQEEINHAHANFLLALASFSDDPFDPLPTEWEQEGTYPNGHQPSHSYEAYQEFIGNCLEYGWDRFSYSSSPASEREAAERRFSNINTRWPFHGGVPDRHAKEIVSFDSPTSSPFIHKGRPRRTQKEILHLEHHAMSMTVMRGDDDRAHRRYSGSAHPTLTNEEVEMCMALYDRRMETMLQRYHVVFLAVLGGFSTNPRDDYPARPTESRERSPQGFLDRHSHAYYHDIIVSCFEKDETGELETRLLHATYVGISSRDICLTAEQVNMIRTRWHQRTEATLTTEGAETLQQLQSMYGELQSLDIDLSYIKEQKEATLARAIEHERFYTTREMRVLHAFHAVANFYRRWHETRALGADALILREKVDNPFYDAATRTAEVIMQEITTSLLGNVSWVAAAYQSDRDVPPKRAVLEEGVVSLEDVLSPAEALLVGALEHRQDISVELIADAVGHDGTSLQGRLDAAYEIFKRTNAAEYRQAIVTNFTEFDMAEEDDLLHRIREFLQTPRPEVITEPAQIGVFRNRIRDARRIIDSAQRCRAVAQHPGKSGFAVQLTTHAQ